jgi:hypothetical protein
MRSASLLLCMVVWYMSVSHVDSLLRSSTRFISGKQQTLSQLRRNSIVARARVARKEEEQEKVSMEEDERMITVPFNGLIGKEQGSLFDKPLDVFDPMKDTDDLPGEDGSDEKIAAIQQRIQDRVEALRKSGEWGDEEVFGKDPLARQPIWTTMAMQLKVCKPFESVDELALTYVLLLATTVVLMAYLLVLRETFDTFILWFVNTDFDSDFSILSLFNQQ